MDNVQNSYWTPRIKKAAQTLVSVTRDGFALTRRSVRSNSICAYPVLRITSADKAVVLCTGLRRRGSISCAVRRRGTAVISLACGFVFFRFAAAGVEFRQRSGRGRFMGHHISRRPAQSRLVLHRFLARCSVVSQHGGSHDPRIQGRLIHVS
jgi:hypothetical protein